MSHPFPADGLSPRLHWLLLAAGRASTRLMQPFHTVLTRRPAPRLRRLVQAMPQPLFTPQVQAVDICRGIWALAGHELRAAGNIIFDLQDAPADWQRELHAFGWIFPLLEGGQRLWLMRARTLLLDWLEHDRRLPSVARHPEVSALRLINWTAAAPALLNDASETFRERFLQGLAAQWRQVRRILPPGLTARARLLMLLARAWGALALEESLATREKALQELATELQRQILPDGGHVSRSPACLLQMLGILLPLREAAETAGLALPPALEQALERALPMLRMLRHADGGLALFHGGRESHRHGVEQLLRHDATAGAPLELAPHSGYARLARRESVAIVDVGAPPHPLANDLGALSPLALEFSSRGRRIITSCGLPLRADARLDAAARRSAAHSMPTLMDSDAGTLREGGLIHRLAGVPAVDGGFSVQAELRQAEHGVLLEAACDAWAKACGLLAERRLFLAADGDDLRGEDAFVPASEGAAAGQKVPFVIRFHLHPSVQASLARDGGSVLLVLPDRSSWTFTARHARLELEESLLLAGRHGPRRSWQIVLRGDCPTQGCRINWRLHRTARPASRRRRKAGAAPTLPLHGQPGE